MLRVLIQNRLLALAGCLAALVGMALGFGIMAYEAIENGERYTTLSWALIAPVWLAAVAFLLLGLYTSRAFLFVLLPVAASGGTYYGDVYGQIPALTLIALAILAYAGSWLTDSLSSLEERLSD